MGQGFWRAALAACLVVGAAGPAAAQQPSPPAITVTRLIGPEGQPMSSADHINDHGLVTGEAPVPPVGFGPPRRAVAWQRGNASYLGPGYGATVLDVSDRGQVVGNVALGFGLSAFSWSGGVYTQIIDPPPGDDPNEPRPFFLRAGGVNERGEVVGIRVDAVAEPWIGEVAVWQRGEVTASFGRTTAFDQLPAVSDLNDRGQVLFNLPLDPVTSVAAVWRIGGRVTRLGTLGGAESVGAAIDERGRVVGDSETSDGETHAFLWQRGRVVDLGTLGGATSTVGGATSAVRADADEAFNDRGEVVGTSETASGDEHAFLWRRGRMVDLGTLGGATSHATALNNRGQVVGYSETASGETHAFLWQRGRMIDLGALVGEGASEALDINDRGQIVGRVGTQAVLWTAPPGPAGPVS